MSLTSRPDSARNHAASVVSRRFFVAAVGLTLAGCGSRVRNVTEPVAGPRATVMVAPWDVERDPMYVSMYGPMPNERFPIPATDLRRIKSRYLRRQVEFNSPYQPGTIIVDTGANYLYLVQPEGMAMRYGIGVGREGFGWSGEATIRRKAAWPTWTPPAEMVARDPKAAEWAGGMPPGLANPLGARALYLYQGGRDTLYRIHGTNEPWSIGSNESSGCIRLINQDIIDLYERVPIGTRVVVLSAGEPLVSDAEDVIPGTETYASLF